MKKTVLAGAILTFFILAAANEAAADTYMIDKAHTSIGFSVRHMVISNVKGHFNEFEGEFLFDQKTAEIKNAEIKINVASIDTNEKKRDDHLRTADFFDAKKNPYIIFKLKSCDSKDGGKLNGTGEITIRGVTRTIDLTGEFLGAVKDPWGNDRVGFSARGELDREDFGIVYNKLLEAGGLIVGKQVKLIIEVEGVKKK